MIEINIEDYTVQSVNDAYHQFEDRISLGHSNLSVLDDAKYIKTFTLPGFNSNLIVYHTGDFDRKYLILGISCIKDVIEVLYQHGHLPIPVKNSLVRKRDYMKEIIESVRKRMFFDLEDVALIYKGCFDEDCSTYSVFWTSIGLLHIMEPNQSKDDYYDFYDQKFVDSNIIGKLAVMGALNEEETRLYGLHQAQRREG